MDSKSSKSQLCRYVPWEQINVFALFSQNKNSQSGWNAGQHYSIVIYENILGIEPESNLHIACSPLVLCKGMPALLKKHCFSPLYSPRGIHPLHYIYVRVPFTREENITENQFGVEITPALAFILKARTEDQFPGLLWPAWFCICASHLSRLPSRWCNRISLHTNTHTHTHWQFELPVSTSSDNNWGTFWDIKPKWSQTTEFFFMAFFAYSFIFVLS